MERAINDSTLTKIGDIYHYYIALLDCFSMKKDDILQIEVNGDISKIAKKNDFSFQKEVKHHIGEDKLSDRDIDLWKTLDNWVTEYERIKSFNKLILFTTSEIPETCAFYGWNNKRCEEKLIIITKIGEKTKKREESFRTHYKSIFSGSGKNNTFLIDVLSKFEIEHCQPEINNISASFNDLIGYIPVMNRDHYIAALLGIILAKVKDPPYTWEVTKEEFDLIQQELIVIYDKPDKIPLPNQFADQIPTKVEHDLYLKKPFVMEIKKIEFDEMITRAVIDFWRMEMTVLKYFSDNFIYNKSLPNYKEDIKTRLNYFKEEKLIDYYEAERPKQISESKKLYTGVMCWKAEDFGSIVQNRPYFQNGVIHDIVNDGNFSWDLGEKDEY
jgi:hypothetical protein